jgi:hypothetical protein
LLAPPLHDGTGFDAAASIQRQTGGKRPRDDTPLLRQREKTVAALNHNVLATAHRNTKMDLTEFELRSFHRPRLPPTRRGAAWRITAPEAPPGGPGGAAGAGAGAGGTVSSRERAAVDLDKKDLSLVGPGGDFLVLEYVEGAWAWCVIVGVAGFLSVRMDWREGGRGRITRLSRGFAPLLASPSTPLL